MAQKQAYEPLKEKVYVQTNHVFFKPGESMWFKVYVVNANDQRPPAASAVVIVDVLSPSGATLRQMRLPLDMGHAQGVFDFTEQMPGGVYKLRAYTSWMKNEKERTFFEKEITLQKIVAPRILMKLEFPVKGYGPGDEVTASYTMRDLSDQPVKFHEVKYQVNIAGEQLSEGRFSTDAEGKYTLHFRLPGNLSSADGLLNITVNYGGFTESISRSIPLLASSIDFQLLPEGGALVAGLRNQIAFRAVDVQGKPVDVKGYVNDERGEVLKFESYKFGMGKFPLVPQAGRVYKAVITSPRNIQQEFALPAASVDGVVLNVLRENGLNIRIAATQEQEMVLTGITHNTTYYRQTLQVKKGEQVININENIFPVGIARFTLYNRNQQPVAERVAFLSSNKTVHTTITTDKKVYGPRDPVQLKIKTTDAGGQPVPADFSLAVLDDKLWTMADDKQDHILSWLLMSSELHGKVEEPQFYFKKEEEKAAGALDLVMLTHGYRYFDYLPEIEQHGKLKYLPEFSMVLEGKVADKNGRGVKADVYLVSTQSGQPAAYTTTNDTGYFRFLGVATDAQSVIIAKAQKAGEQVWVSTNIIKDFKDSVYWGGLAPGAVIYGVPQPAPAMVYEKLNNDKTAYGEGYISSGKTSNLSEVIVYGYSVTQKRNMTGAVSVITSNGVPAGGNLTQALSGKLPGIMVTDGGNPGAGQDIRIRGINTIAMGEPLFVVDNVIMDKPDGGFNGDDVASVTIMKDAEAVAIYGSRAANGVVIVTTKASMPRRFSIPLNKKYFYRTQVVAATQTGTEARRVFYAPNYYVPDTYERTDFRETIYWNGTVQTDKNGEAAVMFYNSDAVTTFRAIAEGIGYDGRPGRGEVTYATKLPVVLDLKVPPYLTVGDKARLPLVITNTTAENKKVHLRLVCPDGLIAGDMPDSLELPANSHQRIYLPVQAFKPLKGRLQLRAIGPGVREQVAFPIEAGAKGFPVLINLSGNETALHQFGIQQPVDNTLTTRFDIYTDGLSEVTAGINDMLREPYGCFEQTASSAYPNIYVLRQLSASGAMRPEIAEKAKRFMETGYSKMAGYEVRGGGFALFGRGPANLSLTAYGLLVFSEIRPYISIDEQMMDRTRDFLLKNLDVKSTAWNNIKSTKDLQRLFTIYALSQAGYGSSVQGEYRAVFTKALQDRDAYQLALVALMADNLKQPGDYQRCMVLLAQSNFANLPSSAIGFMGSRGASLEVETRSLYTLALLRSPQPNMEAIATQLKTIRSLRSYQGYGSTQSTALALNAITTYQLALRRQTMGITASFLLNGQDIKDNGNLNSLLHNGDNNFAVAYHDKNDPSIYNLEIGYYTQLPKNSDKAEIGIQTMLDKTTAKVGETVRLNLVVNNMKPHGQATVLAKIGIPAGLSLQPWQLKELKEQGLFDYYEIFDNYLVFYWTSMNAGETKNIALDLKAETPGIYKGKANTTFLYYMPEHRIWTDGLEIEVN